MKFLIEGEEEVGSEHLEPFLKRQREKLACDCVVISDTSQFGPGVPAITYGLRGIAYFELQLLGPKQDLHSRHVRRRRDEPGQRAGEDARAPWSTTTAACTIPGFYDDVPPLTDRERAAVRRAAVRRSGLQAATRRRRHWPAKKGFSTLERRWARPTFDINGLTSGYQGEGAKTVLPAKASAKFSFRLVPNQDPHEDRRRR